MSNYNLTLFEACELLNRSRKTISRYVRRGLIHPIDIKSKKGVLEYRFSKKDLETFKIEGKIMRQDTSDSETGHQRKKKTLGNTESKEKLLNKEDNNETGHFDSETGHLIKKENNKATKSKKKPLNKKLNSETGHIVTLLKETTGLLKEQLNKKDEQIKDLGGKIDQLIERDRETNILIGQLQSKVLMLGKPNTDKLYKKQHNKKREKPNKTEQGETVKPLKEKKAKLKKTKQIKEKPSKAKLKGKKTADKPKKKGFWRSIFK